MYFFFFFLRLSRIVIFVNYELRIVVGKSRVERNKLIKCGNKACN